MAQTQLENVEACNTKIDQLVRDKVQLARDESNQEAKVYYCCGPTK